jgi:hypothetical protein
MPQSFTEFLMKAIASPSIKLKYMHTPNFTGNSRSNPKLQEVNRARLQNNL